jgi:hypothetical protein
LVVVLLVVITVVLVLWFGVSRETLESAANGGRAPTPGAGQGEVGGVQPREYDEAEGRAQPRLNPAIQLPSAGGLAPEVPAPPEEPPDFETVEEEIAWYEKRLADARSKLEMRTRAVEHLAKSRERAEQSANPNEALAVFEKRKARVEDNHRIAEDRVRELEIKLDELRKGG